MTAPASTTLSSTKRGAAKAVRVVILLQALGVASAGALVCSEALAPWEQSVGGPGIHFLMGS